MNSAAGTILGGIAIGIGATVLMDLWNLYLKQAFGIQSLNFCFVGRWIVHMPNGIFKHRSIAAAEQKPFECVVGWLAHYSTGVTLAVVFVLASGDWLGQPTFLPVLTYGIATVVFPLFVVQPSLGLGMASSRTANPTQARLKSVMTHTVFGVGLYLCAEGVRYALQTMRTS
jgi:hypothetical protein